MLLVTVFSYRDPGTNFMLLGAMVVALFNGISVIVLVLGRMTLVHYQSKIVLSNVYRLNRTYQTRKDGLRIRKYFKSSNKTKIKFGDSNFLEESIPLKCLDVWMD